MALTVDRISTPNPPAHPSGPLVRSPAFRQSARPATPPSRCCKLRRKSGPRDDDLWRLSAAGQSLHRQRLTAGVAISRDERINPVARQGLRRHTASVARWNGGGPCPNGLTADPGRAPLFERDRFVGSVDDRDAGAQRSWGGTGALDMRLITGLNRQGLSTGACAPADPTPALSQEAPPILSSAAPSSSALFPLRSTITPRSSSIGG